MNKNTIKKRISKEKGWLVREKGEAIICDRTYTGKNIEFSLASVGNGLYEIRHPNYLFISTVSHFKSIQEDVRLSLNKVYLKSVVRMLKRTEIWPNIINQNFLEVNDNNRKSNKGQVRAELNNLIG